MRNPGQLPDQGSLKREKTPKLLETLCCCNNQDPNWYRQGY